MSQNNPFAFTGPSVAHQPSSDSSLRAEITRLKRELATALRRVQAAEDANGIARALAHFKTREQELERELKGSRLAERVSREAVIAIRNTHHMSQTSGAASAEVQELRKELEAKHGFIGKLQVELETCKGLLADAALNRDYHNAVHESCERALQSLRDESKQQLDQVTDRLEIIRERNRVLDTELDTAKKELETCASLKIELQNRKDSFNDLNDNFEQHVQAKIEDGEKTIVRLEAELQRASNEHSKTTTEIKAISLENEELKTIAEGLENDNSKIKEGFEEQEKLNLHLNDINDGLRSDLTRASAKNQVLLRERNELEAQLTETQLALERTKKSEADIRDTLLEREAEFELAVHDASVHNEMLQDNIDDYTRQSNEHEQALLVKDERIAFLQQKNKTLGEEKKVLEGKLTEQKEHSSTNASFDRPMSHRQVSVASHKSLLEELEDEQLSDLDDTRSSDAESILSEPETQRELSAVFNVIDISPRNIARPKLTISVNDGLVTTPVRQDSAAGSPACRVSSAELEQAAASKLSLYSETTASFSPLKPKAIPLTMLESIIESISPVEPRRISLMLSTVSEVLNSAPAAPAAPMTALSTGVTIEPQRLSTNVCKTFSYSPVEPGFAKGQRLTLHVPEHSLVSIHPIEVSIPASRNTSSTATSLPHRRSFNPFQRLPAPSGNVDLTEDEKKWPLRDETPHAGILSSTSCADSSTPCPPLTLTSTSNLDDSDVMLFGSEYQSNIQHILFSMLLLLLGLKSTSLPTDAPSSPIIYIMAKQNASALANRLIYIILTSTIAVLAWRWWIVGQQLGAWEHANGVGFGEGYSNVHDRLGQYGNGHVLLGMLPHNLLSADSPLPIAVVEVVTKTMSAFEGFMGFAPGPTMV